MDLRTTLPNQQPALPTQGAKRNVGQQANLLPNQTQSTLNPSSVKSPKFGASGFLGSLVTPMALQQFMVDNVGVYSPKMLTVRSKAQAFEETYLELIEDLAFYFTIPAAGYLFAKLFSKMAKNKHPEISVDALGKSFEGNTAKVSRRLLGNKAATLFGAIAVGAGFEYLIQHTKNWATNKIFNINNFTAVAGLEKARLARVEGEDDAVTKAKKRIVQVSALTALGIGIALALPKIVMKSDLAERHARNLMRYVDFGKGGDFDLPRFGMGIVIASGVASYLDAARDKLERVETATRLAVVVPYLLFGKALMGNFLASTIEKHKKIGKGTERKTIQEHIKPLGLSYRTGKNPIRQFKSPGTFFELGTLNANSEELKSKLANSNLSADVQKGIVKWHNLLTNDMQKLPTGTPLYKALGKQLHSLPLWISALIAGIGINVIAYKQTQNRFHKLHPHEQTPSSPFALAKVFHKPSTENSHYWQADV